MISSKNVGTFFRFVNKRLSCKRGIGARRNKQNATIASNNECANLPNTYCYFTCTEDNGVIPPIQHSVSDNTSIDNICLTKDKVLRAIKKLKPSRSSGPMVSLHFSLKNYRPPWLSHFRYCIRRSCRSDRCQAVGLA